MLPSDITNLTVILTDRHGNAVRGNVVFVQRICDVHSEVHITTSDWLDPYSHEAVHITDSDSVEGVYAVFDCESIGGERWLFKGLFEPSA